MNYELLFKMEREYAVKIERELEELKTELLLMKIRLKSAKRENENLKSEIEQNKNNSNENNIHNTYNTYINKLEIYG